MYPRKLQNILESSLRISHALRSPTYFLNHSSLRYHRAINSVKGHARRQMTKLPNKCAVHTIKARILSFASSFPALLVTYTTPSDSKAKYIPWTAMHNVSCTASKWTPININVHPLQASLTVLLRRSEGATFDIGISNLKTVIQWPQPTLSMPIPNEWNEFNAYMQLLGTTPWRATEELVPNAQRSSF